MEEIQKLLEKNIFAKSFMADKEFVKDAKEIFKSENIKINDEQLAKLMKNIEIQLELKKSEIVSDEELANVSGGVTKKGVARFFIKSACILGIGALGTVAGYGMGYGVVQGIGDEIESDDGMDIKYMTYGGTAGALATAGVSGYLGVLLGNAICKKLDLEELEENKKK